MRYKPPHKEDAIPGEDAFVRARREAREQIDMEFNPPKIALLKSGGRPLNDPFPGRPVEVYLRADVEKWLRQKVREALLRRERLSLSELVNDAVREYIRRDEERRNDGVGA